MVFDNLELVQISIDVCIHLFPVLTSRVLWKVQNQDDFAILAFVCFECFINIGLRRFCINEKHLRVRHGVEAAELERDSTITRSN